MPTTTTRLATEPQKRYIRSLLDKKIAEPQRSDCLAQVDGLGVATASRWIDRLLSLPDVSAVTTSVVESRTPRIHVEYTDVEREDGQVRRVPFLKVPGGSDVPKGSYGLVTQEGATNETAFYRLWIGDRGGWTVDLLVGPSRQRLSRDTAQAIVKKISMDPAGAASRYGHEIGRCGICGLRLTNDESRKRGIGPICAGNWGW